MLFLSGFYTCLIGSKLFIAYLTGRSRSFLSGPIYLWLMRLLGSLLIGFAFLLLIEGLATFGLLDKGTLISELAR